MSFIRREDWGKRSAADGSLLGGYTRLPATPAFDHRVVHAQPERDDDSLQEPCEEARIVQLEHELSELSQQESDRRKHLEDVKERYSRRVREVEEEILVVTASILSCKASLAKLKGQNEAIPPPGPAFLRFVISDSFNMVASCVIVLNVIAITMEEFNPSLTSDLWFLNHFFLAFYSAELVGKICLLRSGFFLGPVISVWFNWLDFMIVLCCIVTTWVRPCFSDRRSRPDHHDASYLLSFLRLLRLTRIIKMINIFLHSDLSWTEGPKFQGFIMCVVAANSILMGLEADLPDCMLWYYAEHLLLVVFSFEIAVRLKRWGCEFFYHRGDMFWNWLDFLLVFGAVVDQWVLPCATFLEALAIGPEKRHEDPDGNLGQVITMLRMARLLRILRLVRLVKGVPPLYTLIRGIMEAMQGMVWVLVLCLLVLYAFALVGIRLIGPRGLVLTDDMNSDVSSIFSGVMQSMFVLFVAMNGEFESLNPVFKALPVSKGVFMLFVVISTWAILSILTAVVSDNMINACYTHRLEMEAEDMAERQKRNVIRLSECLSHSGDPRTNRLICQEEFDTLLDDEDRTQEICEVTGLSGNDLEDLFALLSHNPKDDDQRVVARDAFIEGLQRQNDPVTQRSIMRLEQQMHHLHHAVDKVVDLCEEQLPGTAAKQNLRVTGLRQSQMMFRARKPDQEEKLQQEELQQGQVGTCTSVADAPAGANTTTAIAARGRAAAVAQIQALLQQLLDNDADLEGRQAQVAATTAAGADSAAALGKDGSDTREVSEGVPILDQAVGTPTRKVARARWRLCMAQVGAGAAAGTGELEEMVPDGLHATNVSQL